MRKVALYSLLASVCACTASPADAPSVTYSDSQPIGAWSFDAPAAGASGASGTMMMGGTGGAGGIEPTGGTTVRAPGLSQVRFSVVTRELGGKYAPKNIGAIWISDATRQHVRTLEVWASIRRRYLTKWNAETGGDRTDVISRATLRAHETHEVVWDLTDKMGMPVAPGPFQLIIETTDHSGTGQFLTVPFMLDAPFELTPPETPYYVAMRLTAE